MDKFEIFTLLPPILGAAMLVFFVGFSPLPASGPPLKAVTGQMQLTVEGLPQASMIPEFTLNLKTENRLMDLPVITENLNREINAFDSAVKDETMPGLISYSPDPLVFSRSLQPGDYYLYVQMDGFETSLDFSISEGKITLVTLILSAGTPMRLLRL